MQLDELIQSRVHRILKKIPYYHDVTEQDPPAGLQEIISVASEKLLGVYQNSVQASYENIYFSNKGIYIYADTWQFLDYGQMRSVTVPVTKADDKRLASVLIIQLESQVEIKINVMGIRENTSDVWEITRFLQRVKNDVRKMKNR